MGSQSWETQYVPLELKENLEELYPGLTFEEALQDQESLYQSLMGNFVGQTPISPDNEQTNNQSNSREESSITESGDHDLSLDEAFARSLQLEFENEDDHVAISEPVQNSSRNTEPATTAGSSVSGTSQDDVDPDRMTYDELQSLGEAIGRESRGLSESEISSLPYCKYKKYKKGVFSKKVEIGECVICYESYKNNQYVTSLPCFHRYHTNCINCWLREKKTCPVCQKEVT